MMGGQEHPPGGWVGPQTELELRLCCGSNPRMVLLACLKGRALASSTCPWVSLVPRDSGLVLIWLVQVACTLRHVVAIEDSLWLVRHPPWHLA
jgi:hypothetical protein